MNIQPIQFNQQTKVNFKSTYPVVHWVAETNGSYAPVLSLELARKLQRTVVRILNKIPKSGANLLPKSEEKLKTYMRFCDKDYRAFPRVRSFYDFSTKHSSEYKPVSYIISGEDSESFSDDLTHEIGRQKGLAKSTLGNPYSAESMMAIGNYVRNGLQYVNDDKKRLRGLDGQTYALHTKFEIVRGKTGKFKGFRFVDARFLPEKGPNSPLARYKNSNA